MRANNFGLLMGADCLEHVIQIVREMRRHEIVTPADAYQRFYDLKKIPGMGTDYYTKLVTFLMPAANGAPAFIMDQWTARSMNLLKQDVEGYNPISLNGHYVSATTMNRFINCFVMT